MSLVCFARRMYLHSIQNAHVELYMAFTLLTSSVIDVIFSTSIPMLNGSELLALT